MAGYNPLNTNQEHTVYEFEFNPNVTEQEKKDAYKVAGLVYLSSNTSNKLTVTSRVRANGLIALGYLKFKGKHNIMY